LIGIFSSQYLGEKKMQKISPNNVNNKNKNKRGFRHIKGVYFRKLNLTTINKFYYTIITENNELLFKSNITEKTLVKKINKNKRTHRGHNLTLKKFMKT
jgi:hypothetical protein